MMAVLFYFGGVVDNFVSNGKKRIFAKLNFSQCSVT